MLFDEIYGNYFNAVAAILAEAVKGELTEQKMYDIISSKAFAESMLSIPGALMGGEWSLLKEDMTTPLEHAPKMPLTLLQKRWLKSLLEDPRVKLFDVPATGLEDVAPLYHQDTVVYFDQYADGDPYEDAAYIRHFRTVLQGLREHRRLRITFVNGRGREHTWDCVPLKLEFSLKDDKFRLQIPGKRGINIINIARIRDCSLLEVYDPREADVKESRKKEVVLELTNERNALDRAMLHFSHLEKETIKISDERFQIRLRYDPDDETELLIRILGFGPMIKVLEPDSFIDLIRERLEMQKRF